VICNFVPFSLPFLPSFVFVPTNTFSVYRSETFEARQREAPAAQQFAQWH